MENDGNTITGKVVVDGNLFHYELNNSTSDLLTNFRNLYFKDDNGHEAAVFLKPDETIEEKIALIVGLRKWF